MQMKFTGLMARRMLVNFRVPAEIAQQTLPAGLRPKLVRGYAIAGLCLVRLECVRPQGLPALLGLCSENLATRMAVEWTQQGQQKSAVFIFRRDTASPINGLVSEHVGYGVHHRADIHARDEHGEVTISVRSFDRQQRAQAIAQDAGDRIMRQSVFRTLDEAATFFRGGECGYSPARVFGRWQGVALRMASWDLQAMHVQHAASSLLDTLFMGHAELDSAFIMRNIEHTWMPIGDLPLAQMDANASTWVGRGIWPAGDKPRQQLAAA